MSAYNHRGKVYFVVRGAFVKIGFTASTMEKRLAQLATGYGVICPDEMVFDDPLVVVRLISDCVMRDEIRIHGLFARHHVIGEWYRWCPDLIEQLAQLDYVTYSQGLMNFRHARADIKRRPSYYGLGAAA